MGVQLVMETLPLTSRQIKKLKVAKMKMCRWGCGHTREDGDVDTREKTKRRVMTSGRDYN